ncbi:MAG: hypothetical protein U0231_16245 [Nitrospiraceae bacterium]
MLIAESELPSNLIRVLRRAASPVANNHPGQLAGGGCPAASGTAAGQWLERDSVDFLSNPARSRSFSQAELEAIAGPIADGLKDVGRGERIAFQLIEPGRAQAMTESPERQFLRGRYLHVALKTMPNSQGWIQAGERNGGR